MTAKFIKYVQTFIIIAINKFTFDFYDKYIFETKN